MPVRTMRRFLGLAFILSLAAPATASAITAEVARACDAAVAKAFPPRQVGNPAAGSLNGTPKDKRDYYQKCVANDGKAGDLPPAQAPKDAKPSK